MKKSRSITSKLPGAAAIAGLLLVWHLVCTFGLVPQFMLPSPGQVLTALWEEFPLLLQHARIVITEQNPHKNTPFGGYYSAKLVFCPC